MEVTLSVEEAAEVAFRIIRRMIPKLKYVKKIRFVLYGKEDLTVHKKALLNIFQKKE